MTGIQSASYPEECKNRVKAYMSAIDKLAQDPQIQYIINNTYHQSGKKVFSKENDYITHALDETILMIETLMQDTQDTSRVLPAYQELLNERFLKDINANSARKHLNAQCEKIQKGKESPSSYIPTHLAALAGHIHKEEFSGLIDTWLQLANDIAYTANDEMDHLKTARERYKELEKNIREDEQDFLANYPDMEEQLLQDSDNNNKSAVPAKQGSEFEALLSAYGEDLTEAAKANNSPNEIRYRDNEIRQTMATVLKTHAPFALCVGGSGSGKSSVVEGIAQKIADGNTPEKLKDARVVRLKVREMKASSGQGQIADPILGGAIADLFMNRFHSILKGAAEHNKNNKDQVILNLDELGTMGDKLPIFQARNILAAAMDDYPTLRIIGEISDIDLHALQHDVPKMVEQFQQIRVLPTNTEQTLSLLKNKIAGTGLQQTDEAILKRIIQLTNRFTPEVKQPGAALEILDTAKSYAELDGTDINEDHIVEIISNKRNLSKEMIGGSISERIATLGERLPNMILGQDDAINKIVGSTKVANAGLNDPNKPLGSYLLVGPTGVGKTETSKALAKCLNVPLITIDMSNYQEQHAKAKLIGSPPGYVGYQDKAALEQVAESPSCVLLLDEIEKAHGDVLNILLSVLDEGRAQLQNGKDVDFKNCIILMTSNLGEKDAQAAKEKNGIGFTTGSEDDQKKEKEQRADDVREQAIKDRLPPEFINRLDGILKYHALQIEVARGIAKQKVAKVSAFLQDKNQNLSLKISKKAMDQLVTAGYDELYGARPMDRAIKDLIKEPLAEWIVENGASITEPTTLYVKGVENKFDVQIKKAANGPAPKA